MFRTFKSRHPVEHIMFRRYKSRIPVEHVKNLIEKTKAKIKQSRKTKNLRKKTLMKLLLKKLKDKLKQKVKKSRRGEVWSEQSECFSDSLSEIQELEDSMAELEGFHQLGTTLFKFSMYQNFEMRIDPVTYYSIIRCIFLSLLCVFIINTLFNSLTSGNCIFTQMLTL